MAARFNPHTRGSWVGRLHFPIANFLSATLLVSIYGCAVSLHAPAPEPDSASVSARVEPVVDEDSRRPQTVAVIMPESLDGLTYEGTPCTIPIHIPVEHEIAALVGQKLSGRFRQVETVATRDEAIGRYDVLVEMTSIKFRLLPTYCSAVWMPIDLAMTVMTMGLWPINALDIKKVWAEIQFETVVFDREGRRLGVYSGKGDEKEYVPMLFGSSIPPVRTAVAGAASEAVYGWWEAFWDYKKSVYAYLANLEKAGIVTVQGLRRDQPRAAGSPTREVNIEEVPEFGLAVRPHDIAVVIGIEQYRDLPKAEFADRDAKLMKAYLLVLGFPERNIELLINERATRSSFGKSLETWLANRAQPDSRIFIYYSGHGTPDPVSGEAFLVPYDGDPNYLADTAYPLKRLYAALEKVPMAEGIVVMDACFSGAGTKSVLAAGAKPLVTVNEGNILPEHVVAFFSSESNQVATVARSKKHGLFTYHFLKAMKEGKRDLSENYEALKPAVEDDAKRQNIAQTPAIKPSLERVRGRSLVQR